MESPPAPNASAPAFALALLPVRRVFWKFMRKDEVHFGVHFQDGLNTDPIPFQTAKECSPGGFYFFEECDAHLWLGLYEDIKWVRKVHVPDGVPLHHESNGKWKAAQIFLHPKQYFDEWLAERPDVARNAVTHQSYGLSRIPWSMRTHDLCMIAVKRWAALDINVLQWVPCGMMTPELCIAAVQRSPVALESIPKVMITPEVCLAAINHAVQDCES